MTVTTIAGPPKAVAAGADSQSSQVTYYHRRKLPPSCIAYESAEGIELFRTSFQAGFAFAHFPLVAQFHTQDDPSFCGLGTLAMVLNALGIDPQRVWKGVWRWFDESLLDCCKPLDKVRTGGITIDEFQCLATCNGADAMVFRPTGEEEGDEEVQKKNALKDAAAAITTVKSSAAETGGGDSQSGGGCTSCGSCEEALVDAHDPDMRPGSLEHFRDTVRRLTSQPAGVLKSALVVAYSRATLKQTGDGHFSPIGASRPSDAACGVLCPVMFAPFESPARPLAVVEASGGRRAPHSFVRIVAFTNELLPAPWAPHRRVRIPLTSVAPPLPSLSLTLTLSVTQNSRHPHNTTRNAQYGMRRQVLTSPCLTRCSSWTWLDSSTLRTGCLFPSCTRYARAMGSLGAPQAPETPLPGC
jgi:hypothetical protein